MPNTYKNKVVVDGTTLIDLTADTITESALMQGYTAHDASGAPITGTATGGSMVIRDEADSHGGTIRHITAGTVVTGTTSITENGSYDVAQYADAVVSVPAPAPSLQSKTATPTESQQTIQPDSGYDGLSSVSVGAISSTYVGTGITRRSSTDLTASGDTVTVPSGYYAAQASKAVASGTAGTPTATKGTVSNHAVSVTPSVTNTAGYISGGTKTGTAVSVSASELVSGTLSITSSGTKDVTNYASASVAAGGATASATKGTVSNHSVTVTPSVTRTAGYVTAGSSNGTAVTVSASELVSGTKAITGAGTTDVTEYASASVASGDATASATKGAVSNHSVTVTPSVTRTAGWVTAGSSNGTAVTVSASELVSGTLSVTENGTADVTNYASVDVDVAGSSTAYTATITRVGTGTAPYVRVNGSGTIYRADGETFTFNDGDYLYFFLGATSDYYTYAYVNGVLVSNGDAYYTWYPPCYDVEIEFEASGDNRYVRITTPTISITQNGMYDVSEYAAANVNVSGGGSGDLKGLIERTVTTLTLPSDLTTIGNSAFRGCTVLELTSLPSGITLIGEYAFYNCGRIALTSLPSGVTTIGTNAFSSCTALALTSLPSGLTSITDYAFYSCTHITPTSLPSGIKSIGSYAFYACYLLALTSLPSALTSIGTYAFARCESIVSIQSDAAITTLGTNAFIGSSAHPSNLTTARFPNMALTSNLGTVFGSTTAANACQLLETCDLGSTTGIAASSFANCYKLQTLVLRKSASVCTLANVSAFTNTPMRGYNELTGTVYVPSALISSYQTATNWSTLYNDGTVTFAAIEGSEWEL